MRIYFLCLTFALVLVACAPAATPGDSSSSSSISSSFVSSVAINLYEDSGIGYSITVPQGWVTLEGKEVVTTNYQVKGTAFVALADTGTTLNEAYFHVAQIASCPKLSSSASTSESVVIAGTTFQRTSWNEAAAGNLYEGITYAGPKDAGCLLLTGYLHSCNLGVDCGENHSAPFNKQAYLSVFDGMAKSVQFLANPGD